MSKTRRYENPYIRQAYIKLTWFKASYLKIDVKIEFKEQGKVLADKVSDEE